MSDRRKSVRQHREKLQSWVDYLKNERAERDSHKDSIDEKIENFLGTVRNVQGMEIWDNETRGRMVREALGIYFQYRQKKWIYTPKYRGSLFGGEKTLKRF